MRQPERIGIEKEEKHNTQSHQIHVDHQEYASVIEAPAGPHTSKVIDRSGNSDEDGQDKQRGGMVIRKIGEQDRDAKAEENQERAPKKRTATRVE